MKLITIVSTIVMMLSVLAIDMHDVFGRPFKVIVICSIIAVLSIILDWITNPTDE